MIQHEAQMNHTVAALLFSRWNCGMVIPIHSFSVRSTNKKHSQVSYIAAKLPKLSGTVNPNHSSG
jgi:hypothetical protein